MAISSGFGPHFAWVSVNGLSFLLDHGSVHLRGDSATGGYRGRLPMGLPGAYETFSALGANSSSIIVQTRGITNSLIVGPIQNINFNFIAGEIDFTGQDAGATLHSTKTAEKVSNMTGAQIVQMWAGRLGLPVQIEGSGGLMAGKTVDLKNYDKLTDGASIAAGIQKLAELDGARWYVDGAGTLHYVVGNAVAGGSYALNYKPGMPKSADFFELIVEVNVDASQTQQVTMNSFQYNEKKTNSFTATAGGRVTGTKLYKARVANSTSDHVKAFAQAKADQIARHGVTIVAHCVGDPTITINQGVSLTGTGAFDGAYTMDEINHSVGMRGHVMTLTARTAEGGGGSSSNGPNTPATPSSTPPATEPTGTPAPNSLPGELLGHGLR